MKSILFVVLVVSLLGCNSQRKLEPIQVSVLTSDHVNNPSDSLLHFWHIKDIILDTLAGISLDRALKDVIPFKKPNTVIVAVIDGEVDVNHPDIRPLLWSNPNEIPDNGIDDDKNGYIDDINGWNFIGNPDGVSAIYSHFEVARIVSMYQKEFSKYENESDSTKIPSSKEYTIYLKAKAIFDKELNLAKAIAQNGPKVVNDYAQAFENLKPHILEKDYTLDRLDSLSKIYPELKDDIALAKNSVTGNQTLAEMKSVLKMYQNTVKYYLNLDYNERELVGDNPNDLQDINYGNNQISNNYQILNHGTRVAGVISSIVNNKYFSEKIKIMPLVISNYGDEQDKDMALAIRYAVDNGAHIINISSSKKFSLHQNWVMDAIRYAEENDVLIITSAGNDSSNLDAYKLFNYPNDTDENNHEIVSNFIKVGASGFALTEGLYFIKSNYGKNEVDLFAPGVKIFTANEHKSHGFVEGTSFAAPVVSGIASIIRSLFPELTAPQVKKILMDSGLEFDILVNIKTSNGEIDQKPFNELSKTGKIVNLYNALLLAEEY